MLLNNHCSHIVMSYEIFYIDILAVSHDQLCDSSKIPIKFQQVVVDHIVLDQRCK